VGGFAQRVKAWATTTGVPVIDCKAGECKHLIAEERLAAHPPSQPGCSWCWLDIPALRTLFGLKNRRHHNRAARARPANP